MPIENDTRGWIMTCISGVACVVGASIICVDVIVRLFPHMHNFRIAESDAFLSASLSLSFGVMLFSSLYSMLPQSKTYLEDGGFSPRAASYLLIGLFLLGVIGIRILSGVLHHFIPSHIVDCDHTHDEETAAKGAEEMSQHTPDDEHTLGSQGTKATSAEPEDDDEETPLLSRTGSVVQQESRRSSAPQVHELVRRPSFENGFVTAPTSRRPSAMPRILSRTLTRYVAGKKDNCDENGPCMGFSDPCGKDCFKVATRRTSGLTSHTASRAPTWKHAPLEHNHHPHAPLIEAEDESYPESQTPERQPSLLKSRTDSEVPTLQQAQAAKPKATSRQHHHPEHEHPASTPKPTERGEQQDSYGTEHHHHVPTNAFMSIGLQTSIAIALHKAPEGFITYATNHANPTLGFAVFMALFIHNITEGFAMSLPLFLALESRFKAIFWSSILGGLSQPLGAGIAALWFKLAKGSHHGGPSEGVYGGMFAVTAGVMASVALSLFSESLQLSHNKGTCIAFAFLGMAILGISFAMTAK